MSVRVYPILLTFMAALVLSGCGGGMPSVTGMVTIDGKPAPPGLQIDFQPDVPNSSSSTGYTDEAGNYEMRFTPAKPGVMLGVSKVQVYVPRKMNSDGIPAIPPQLKGIKIPKEYNEQSELTYEVQGGSNTFDIDIQTK